MYCKCTVKSMITVEAKLPLLTWHIKKMEKSHYPLLMSMITSKPKTVSCR